MSTTNPAPLPEVLLAHRHFLRAIARSLVHGDAADDIVQETFLRASQAGQSPGRLRAWLARIVRNLGIDQRRAEQRRERLEACADAPADAPSPAEVLQHEEQRQRVVLAVLALPQPYRSTVLLRYWEGLTPAAIAQRLGVPGATVRSQLLRGLQMLRAKLDADHGDCRAWLAPAALGAVAVMNTKIVSSFAALLLVGLMAWWWWPEDPVPAAPTGTAVVASGDAAQGGVGRVPGAGAAEPAEVVAGARVEAVPVGDLVVRGQVMHKGTPHPSLLLTLQWFDGVEPLGTAVAEHGIACDAEGRFVWRGPLRTSIASVRAVAPKQPVRLWCDPQVVQPGQREVALEATVIPLDRVLFGRVHDGAGAAIGGARLDVNSWDETAVTTGADGRYEMRVPAPGYPLLVTAAGYRQRLVNGYLPADAMRHEFDVELLPGERCTGRVVDEHGAPIAGAKVSASGLFGSVLSDAEGRFVLEGHEPGSRQMVSANKPGFQTGQELMSQAGAPVEIVLKPGLAVGVRVRSADGAPVVGATIHLEKNNSGWWRKGTTDADGRLRLVDLAAGALEAITQKPGFVTERVQFDPAEVAGEVEITLRPGFAVRGRVLDLAGAPVAGASVYCERGDAEIGRRSVGSRANSDAEGNFELTGLPPESLTVKVHHKDFNRGSIAIRGGQGGDLELRLTPAPAVAGRVVDGATGAAIRDFTVIVTADYKVQSLVYMNPLPFRTKDGRWLVRDWQMQAGAELFVEVQAAGYASAKVRSAAVVDPPPDQNVIRLFAGVRVEGVVRDAANGQPIAGVQVSLARESTRLPMRDDGAKVTAADGAFALEGVPPGEQRLRLEHVDYPEVEFGPFTVGSGPGSLVLEPRLGRGVTLRGRVTGAPDAAGLTVRAWHFGRRHVEGKVRADLTFELAGLGPGKTSVDVTDRAGRSRGWRVAVGDVDLEVELPLRAGTGSIRATVQGCTTGVVNLSPVDAGAGRLRFLDILQFQDAKFAIEGLAPGRYKLVVQSLDGGPESIREVVVGDGELAVTVECPKR